MAITYSIDGGADATKFNINSTSGALTFKAAPDFEQPGDANGDNIYEVSVKAADAGGLSSSKLVKVTVTDVSEGSPPQITSAGAVTVKENSTTVMTVTATDPDDTTTPPIEPPVEPPATGDRPGPSNTGYKNAPGYPGSLTAGPSSLTANTTYSFKSFGGITVSVPGVKFIGCQFKSNWVDGWNIKLNQTGAAVEFKFCTIEPSVVSAPPQAAWPSAGAGKNVDGTTGGGFEPYMIGHNQGYQYGIYQQNGAMLLEDCDIWGFGNSVCLFGSAQKTIRRCWIHDAAAEGTGSGMYHQDGPGHLDGGGCSNVLIENCTIASLGNTNGIAFQAGTYNNIIVRGNYLSGFGFCVDMCHGTAGNTNLVFEDNVIATDIGWHWGPLYTNFTTNFQKPGSSWKRNKLRVMPGTVPASSSNAKYTSADDGKFIHPNSSYSTTDWAG